MAMAIIDEVVHEFLEWSFMRERLGILADVRRKLESIHARGDLEIGEDPQERIRRVLKNVAVGMREGNGRGCQFLMAINEYVAGSSMKLTIPAFLDSVVPVAKEPAHDLTS